MSHVPPSNNYSNGRRTSDEADRKLMMELDRQDAEVGSILIALANHPPPTTTTAPEPGTTTTKLAKSHASSSHSQESMSIQNLLGYSNDIRKNISSSNNVSRERRNSDVMPGSRPDAVATTPAFVRGPQYMQQQPLLEKTTMPSFAAAGSSSNPSSSHHPARQQQHIHTRHPAGGNSKIKRNALHAYISYMIYTDLATAATTATTTSLNHIQQYHQKSSFERRGFTPIHTGTNTRPLGPSSSSPPADALESTPVHQRQDTIIHQPLTAFLREPEPKSYNATPPLPGYLHPGKKNM